MEERASGLQLKVDYIHKVGQEHHISGTVMRTRELISLPSRSLHTAWKRHPLAVTLAVVLGLGIVLHGPLLRGVAWLLVVQEEPGRAQTLGLRSADGFSFDGDVDFQQVPGLMRRAGLQRVLVLEPLPPRLVRDGLQPSFAQLCRQQLSTLGLAADRIDTVDAQSRTFWDDARAIGCWLKAHPDEQLALLAEPFRTGNHRLVLNRVLAPSEAARVHVLSVPARNFDVAQWWRSRLGVKACLTAGLRMLYIRLYSETAGLPEPWDPDRFEAGLRSDRSTPGEHAP